MAVSGITNTLVLQSATLSPAQQWRNDFRDLSRALDSGDINSARRAFASVQQLQSGLSKVTLQAITGLKGSGEGQSTLASDFTELGQALKSGSLAKSQTALAQLQSNLHANVQNTNQNGISAYASIAPAPAERSSTGFTMAESTTGNSTFSIMA